MSHSIPRLSPVMIFLSHVSPCVTLKNIGLHDSFVERTVLRLHDSRLFSAQFQEVSTQNRDEFTVFAEHVAIRLKNITDVRARLVAQHQINNILFEAEMGKYNVQSSYNSTQIMDEPSTSNEEKVMINMS